MWKGTVFDPAGQCMAKDQYIGQLNEAFATSLPSRIAAFFAEPIQVLYSVVEHYWLYAMDVRFTNKMDIYWTIWF